MEKSNNILYLGDIRIGDEVIKKDVLLGYNSFKDKFYDYFTVFPLELSLLFEPEKLTEEEKVRYEEIINQNTYSYHAPNSSNEVYVDESSLRIKDAEDRKKHK